MKILILEPITDLLAKDVISQIALNQDDSIDVLIMSPGGSVFAGNAIISALNGATATVNTRVIGVAGSMAAVISQAGDNREIDADAQFNLHFGAFPISGRGTKEDHEQAIAVLDNINKMMLFKLKGKLGKRDLIKLLSEDRLMDAKEAVELGFFDRITEPLKAVALLNNDNMKTEDFKKVISKAWALVGVEKPIDEDEKKLVDSMLEAAEKKAKEDAQARIDEAKGGKAAEILTANMVTFKEFEAYKNIYTPLMKTLLNTLEQMPTTEQTEAIIKEKVEAELLIALKAIRSQTVAPRSAGNGLPEQPEVVEDDHKSWNEAKAKIEENKV